MRSIAISFCVFLGMISLQSIQAKPSGLSETIVQLGAEKSAERKAAAETLLHAAKDREKEVVSLLLKQGKTSKDPEVSAQSEELIEKIYRRYTLGEGRPYFGFSLGWLIDRTADELTSLPLILTVDAGSPAEKAGFKPGDAIFLYNGEPCKGLNSRNELVRQLVSVPAGKSITFKVRYNSVSKPFENYQKWKKSDRVITPTARTKKNSEKAPLDSDAFTEWLAKYSGEVKK